MPPRARRDRLRVPHPAPVVPPRRRHNDPEPAHDEEPAEEDGDNNDNDDDDREEPDAGDEANEAEEPVPEQEDHVPGEAGCCLEYNENLQPGRCPDCGWARGFHQHKPAHPLAAAASALVSTRAKEQRDVEKSTISTLNAVFKDEKKWGTIVKETATQFMERVKRGLEACGSVVAVEQYYRVFRLVIDPAQIEMSEWVNKNIVDTKLSWDDASSQFIRRYTLPDEKEQLTKEFMDCRQRSDQTCQEYSQHFQRLATQQGVDLNIAATANQYRHGLLPALQERLIEEVKSIRIKDAAFEIKTLSEATRIAELLAGQSTNVNDKSSRTSDSTHRDRNNKLVRSTAQRTPASKDKHCSLHGWCSHTSETCHGLKSQSVQQGQSGERKGPPLAPARLASQTGAGSAGPAVFTGSCFNCGKIGHRKADCRSPPKGTGISGQTGVVPGMKASHPSPATNRSAKRVKRTKGTGQE